MAVEKGHRQHAGSVLWGRREARQLGAGTAVVGWVGGPSGVE